MQQLIGLGPATRIAELRVSWPNRQRTVEVHTQLAVNRYYRVIEGADVHALDWQPVRLGGGSPARR